MPSKRPPVATVSMWLPVSTGGSVASGGHVPNDVADLVDVDAQAEVAHPRDHEVTAVPVVVGEREPGVAARPFAPVDRADLSQLVEPQRAQRHRDAQILHHRRAVLRTSAHIEQGAPECARPGLTGPGQA